MDELHKDLSRHRFWQAQNALNSAKALIEIKDFEGAANRLYYATFHALRSILALDEQDFKKHSAVISYFRREYIKTKIFPIEISDVIGKAFEMRNDSDYDDYYDVSGEEVKDLLINVSELINLIDVYLKDRI